MEGVGCICEGLLWIVAPLGDGVCFSDRAVRSGGWSGGRLGECGKLRGGRGKQGDFLGEEALKGKGWSNAEGRLEDADFGSYEEFLVGGWDGHLGFDKNGEIIDCGRSGQGEFMWFSMMEDGD